MNARKVILVLGVLLLALIAALVAFALFSHKKMEGEKNAAKTAPARARRWAEKEFLADVPKIETEIIVPDVESVS